MKYDDASWHLGNQRLSAGAEAINVPPHMGLFLTWMFENGMASELHLQSNPDSVRAVISHTLSGRAFLEQFCDGKLTSDEFTEHGNQFAEHYYSERYLREYSGSDTIPFDEYPDAENDQDLSRELAYNDIRIAYNQWCNTPERLDYSEFPLFVQLNTMTEKERNALYVKQLLPYSWERRKSTAQKTPMRTEDLLIMVKILGEENWTGNLHLLAETARYSLPIMNEEQLTLMDRLSRLSDNYADIVFNLVQDAFTECPVLRGEKSQPIPESFHLNAFLHSDNDHQRLAGLKALCTHSLYKDDQKVSENARKLLLNFVQDHTLNNKESALLLKTSSQWKDTTTDQTDYISGSTMQPMTRRHG